MTIRVLIADDHPLVRDGLRFSIERSDREIEVVAEAKDGIEALDLAKSRRPDVCVLDITMPRLNGLDAAKVLRKGSPRTRVIILSLHDSRDFVDQALEAGATGYITKESASRHLVEAICEVHAGRSYLSPDITHLLVVRGRDERARTTKELTLPERRVLQLIAEGFTTKEIASSLGRAENTIRTQRKSLMAKLDVHKQTELVRFAVRLGLAKL